MKKRKIKLWVKILFLIIVIIFIFKPISNENIEKNIKKNDIQEEKIEDTLYNKLKDYGIEKDFLEWIDKNFPGKANKLNELLSKEEYNIKMWHEATGYSYLVLNDLYNNLYENMDNVKVIKSNDISTLSFVGDISLADNWYIMPKYDERGKKVNGILSETVLKIMTESDLMVANSEFTVSNRGKAMSGKQYTFRAKPERLLIYEEMGVDLVTLANNHVYDFGRDAFLDMLKAFDDYKIPHIGAGHNLEEAKKEYYFIINGYKIAFLNGTRAEKYILTPGATETKEGVFRCYDPTNMINNIEKVSQVVQSVGPVVEQYGPIMRSLPSIVKILTSGKSTEENQTENVTEPVEVESPPPAPQKKKRKRKKIVIEPVIEKELPKEPVQQTATKPKLYV